ncbi:uroporphyrinogen III methyltransferase [Alphaproteobacteria bacterium]|nr:uroporphyrinogen III methyltransferase [Alphaproteobacteria bacterium]
MTPPLALLTRPKEDSEQLRPLVESIGFAAMIEPMLTIEFTPAAALPEAQGYVVTSANGARALRRKGARLDLPLWAVGEGTAEKAACLGFSDIRFAGGNVAALASLLQKDVDPQRGPLLHARGVDQAADLAGMARTFGLQLLEAPLYRAEKTKTFSEPAKNALREGRIACALFFSPRSAETFVTLVKRIGLVSACRRVEAFALSEAILERLRLLPWAKTHAPDEPRQAALLELLKRLYDGDDAVF